MEMEKKRMLPYGEKVEISTNYFNYDDAWDSNVFDKYANGGKIPSKQDRKPLVQLEIEPIVMSSWPRSAIVAGTAAALIFVALIIFLMLYLFTPHLLGFHQKNPSQKPPYRGDPLRRNFLTPSERTCSLKIIVGHRLWNHIHEEEGNDADRTELRLRKISEEMVGAASDLFGPISFDGIKGINFELDNLTMVDSYYCSSNPSSAYCAFHKEPLAYLKGHESEDHSGHCLAYLFEYDETSPFRGASHAPFDSECEDEDRGICGSFNRGYINFYDNNAKTELAFLHELGHSFGARHDEECESNDPDASFLMSKYPSEGAPQFSDCSIASISKILNAMLRRWSDRKVSNPRWRKNCFV